jgi:hypothetical protein
VKTLTAPPIAVAENSRRTPGVRVGGAGPFEQNARFEAPRPGLWLIGNLSVAAQRGDGQPDLLEDDLVAEDFELLGDAVP